jgi:hypothetical protein
LAVQWLNWALERDPKFAMAVWSIGEIEKQRGNAIIARSFEEAADRIDRDHPRWALYDRSNDINPIHEVLSSRSTATTVPFEGGS